MADSTFLSATTFPSWPSGASPTNVAVPGGIPAGAEVALIWFGGFDTTSVSSVTSNFTTGSWTIFEQAQTPSTDVVAVAYARVTSSPGSPTVSASFAGFPSTGPAPVIAFLDDVTSAGTWVGDIGTDADPGNNAPVVTINSGANMLLLAFESHEGAIPALPSGWTNGAVYSAQQNLQGSRVSYRVGTPGPTTTYTGSGGTNTYATALVISVLGVSGGGATNYSLTCDTGAYSLTGVAATTTRGIRLVADVGSYGITGQAASTSRGYRLTADVGSYALTGQSAATTRGVRLVAETGAYALTGQDATLVYAAGPTNYTLACDVGAYVLTGVDATLTYSAGAANYSLACDAGAYSLTGIDATLTYTPGTANYTLTCDVGSYALSGQGAVTSLGRRLIADVGSYSLTGVSATLNRGYRLSADTGAYAFTGYDATLTATVSTAYTLICETGVYSITGQDAALRYSGEVTRRRHAGTRKNYIIKGQKYALTDYELRMLIQQMLDEVKRPEIQVVTEKEVKQVSRRVWKRLKESLSSLEALTLEKVESVVESNVIEYDDEDDEEILMLL